LSIVGAVVSASRQDVKEKVISLGSDNDFVAVSESYAVVARTSPTCMSVRASSTSDSAFLVVDGSPLCVKGRAFTRPGRVELASVLKEKISVLHQKLLGQYVAVRSAGDGLQIFTDANCLRSLFVYQQDDYVLFSSRLEGISDLVSGLTIDFERFGSHWLAHNQLSETFFIKGVSRLSGRPWLELRAGHQSAVQANFHDVGIDSGYSADDERPGSVEEVDPFVELTGLLESYKGPIRLALSGGIDSRLLLSLAHFSRTRDFGVITYETADGRDAGIAQRLADVLAIPCERIPAQPLGNLIGSGIIERFARESFCISPLSAAAQLTNYRQIFDADSDTILMDGAFGEVGRTRFYRKVEWLRRIRTIRQPQIDDYVNALSFYRAGVFTEEVHRSMQEGFRADVDAFVSGLESPNQARPEDLAGVRFRRSNFFGYAQAWIDNFGFNFMPFGQNCCISGILDIPVARRRGSAYFKGLVRKNAPAAAKIPLSKGPSMVPFALPAMLVPFYASMLREKRQHTSLWTEHRDYVYDTIQSSTTRSFGAYDMKKVDHLVSRLFSGRTELHSALDWFLSFELWRRGHSLQ